MTGFRLRPWLARLYPHWPVLLVLLAGFVLRLLTMIAYAPGLWFTGDSGIYVRGAHTLVPDPARPLGYSLFLWPFLPLHSVQLIIVVQHLIGLAVGVALYVFLRRRGVRRWIATAAAAVFLLDARTALLEQFLLAETVYTALLVTGLLLISWRGGPDGRPGVVACAVAGLVLAFAASTRTVGLPLVAIAGLYLLLRRVNWVRLGVFGLAVLLPLVGYAALYEHHTGKFGLGTYGGRFLWARVSTFVDCDRLALTEAERPLCPPEPLGQRKPADLYLWSRDSPNVRFAGRGNDARFARFARKAILAQPVDYARTVTVESLMMLLPTGAPDSRYRCFDKVWRMPASGVTDGCQPQMAPSDTDGRRFTRWAGQHDHALTGPMHGYAKVATVPATVTAIALLAAIGAAVRRRRWELDSLFWTVVAFAAIPLSVGTSVMEPRYAVPSLPVALVGLALAVGARRPSPGPAEDPAAPTDSPPAPRLPARDLVTG